MSISDAVLGHLATPIVSSNFVVVQIAGTGAHRALITDINTQLAAITKSYPDNPTGVLIGNTSGATMHIRTSNSGGTASTLGIPIGTDQSIYLPVDSMGTEVEFSATNATSISVAVFYRADRSGI
jgi:hypothetical protein